MEPHEETPDTTIACWPGEDGTTVITLFIGTNRFETEVDGGLYDGETAYFDSWSEAEEGHLRMVEKVKDAIP